jgi:hypothetical protein
MRYSQLIETKLGGFTVKPLHIEQGNMDEADLNRRGFLKGMGAAAVAGAAGGAKAQDVSYDEAARIAVQKAQQSISKFISLTIGGSKSRILDYIGENVNKAILAYCIDTDAYNVMAVIDYATNRAYQAGDAVPIAIIDRSSSATSISVANAFMNAYSAAIAQKFNEYKKRSQIGTPPVQDQLNNDLKVTYVDTNKRVGDIVVTKGNNTLPDGTKLEIVKIVGPADLPGKRPIKALGKIIESVNQGVAEAIKLDAPQKSWSRQDMQAYLTRIKTGTKTKQDRFKPIIHGSNVKAMVKDDGTEEWDLEDLKRQITTPPRAILGSNAKMSKSKKEGAITYDLTLPALSGIVVDEETGEFVEITTCPGAGECQLFCYARKGGYVMFPAASMSAAQALNFLVNHPDEYMQMFDTEIKRTKALADKNGIKLLVRIHDAGDFFSKEYWDLSKRVQLNNPDVRFYFYSKMGDPVTDPNTPSNTLPNFSDGGAKSREVKKVEFHRNAGKNLKGAPTIPKDMFRNLFVTDAKGKYVKDEQGRTQVRGAEAWDEFKQQLSAKYRIDPASIITYDQMNRIPEGPKPQWNVVVFPAGHGDLGATRLDVQNQFLMFH